MRALYERVGMHGEFLGPTVGDQIRGTGFSHDGFTSNLFIFLGGESRNGVFFFPGTDAEQIAMKRELEAFLLALDSDFAPIVGQQVTVTNASASSSLLKHEVGSAAARIDLMRARAGVSSPRAECDLIVSGTIGGEKRSWFMQASGDYLGDDGTTLSHAALLALSDSQEEALTFTCAYPGSGNRVAIDRDSNGVSDKSECGDFDSDGVAGSYDVLAIQNQLVGKQALANEERCNVVDAENEASNTCSIADALVIARSARRLASSKRQICDLG
ncbi:MAG: hypothetical protein HRT81_15985 [Henriciella sp.]|nr:hypothetical protein [Henriciella sp.]